MRPPKPELNIPVLTEEHKAFIAIRKELRAVEIEAEKALRRHLKTCPDHLFAPTGKYEYWNKHWSINCGVKCLLCGYESGEWFCPESTKHFPVCEYEGGDEYCINCGTPDERK